MALELVSPKRLEQIFLEGIPLLDVRAPVEFAQGSLPHAVNFAILNDEERAQVGTEYKLNGQQKAVELGEKLVSGEVKESRIQQWTSHYQKNPSLLLYCFRGGQRSRIAQGWLAERKIEIPRLEGGYKVARQFLIENIEGFSRAKEFLPLAGPTGSGKTFLIDDVKTYYPSLDLETLARHRGSAFGSWEVAQPAQIDFENQLSVEMLKLKNQNLNVLVEDESRLIGKNVIPDTLFEKINSSPVLLVDESLAQRVENIFLTYISESRIVRGNFEEAVGVFAKYRASLLRINKKLGDERTREVLGLLNKSESDFKNQSQLASNRDWIEKLLVYYYDPMYLSSLKRRDVKVVFKGSRIACFEYLKEKGQRREKQ